MKPKDVVRGMLGALEAGRHEALVDEITRQVKAGLPDELGIDLDDYP